MALKWIDSQQKTRNDDIAAFEMLFRKYYEPLVRFSTSFTDDVDSAEEIVQDFFYKYWKNRKEIRIKFSVKSYFYTSVRNNSLKYLEALDVRRKYAERVIAGDGEGSGYDDSGIEYSELNELIEGALDEMPERCSTIFRMSRFRGLKYEEIASELSISVKTVEANMGKALKILRERVGRYYGSVAF
ncbi:MAG: RNA polymerase sigma-70 factor [Marinilabiliales bacterium]|nr:MAG: RNA polymerase sigma-70 factor [Marinilabiliales bacterium]